MAAELLINLMDITESAQGVIMSFESKQLTRWYAREKGSNDWLPELPFDAMSISEFAEKEHGEYFINWNDLGDVEEESGIPKWKSMIVIPCQLTETKKAVMVFSVPISVKEFDFADFNFVNSMSGLLNAIL